MQDNSSSRDTCKQGTYQYQQQYIQQTDEAEDKTAELKCLQ
jgi:hypothetical protein